MTSTDLSASPPAATDISGVVASVTGALPMAVRVTAVIVTCGPTPYFDETLAAVRAQTRRPDEIVVVDAAATAATAGYQGLRLDDARFVAAPRARSFGQAVDAALAEAGECTWLWLLHDDSAPEPTALNALLRAVEHSPSTGVCGPKQQRWSPGSDPHQAGRLIEVGVTVSPLGRRMTGIGEDEIDQGQHDDDAENDRYAVGLAGALVRRNVWQELGGTDPELGPYGDGVDLCRRARLAGHRVVVAPRAVVRHAQASLTGLRRRPDGPADVESSFGARRRSLLHARLTSVRAIWLPFVALAMVLWAPPRAVYQLVVKQPQHAWDELIAPLWCLARFGAVGRARRRARRTAKVPRSALLDVRASWRDVSQERRRRRMIRQEHSTEYVPTPFERADLRRMAFARRRVLVLVAVVLIAVTAVLFGRVVPTLLAGGRLTGAALPAASTSLGDVLRAAVDGWVSTGTGVGAPADPFLAVLLLFATLAGGSAQAAVNILLVSAFLCAGLGAWFAAGAVTRSPWLRAWAVLVWIAAPALTAALSGGRIGPLLAHVALPWFALALMRGLGARVVDVPRPEPGSAVRRPPVPSFVGAVAAAGLAMAVVVAGAPVLLPVLVAALVVVAVAVPRHRARVAFVPLPALAVCAPYLAHVATTWSSGGWRLLFAETGTPVAGAPAAPWEQLLGEPQAPAAWFDSGSATLATLAQWGPYLSGGVVLALALFGLLTLRRGTAAAWLIALIGLAGAVVASGTVVAVDRAGGAVSGWAGPCLSVTLLALLGAALAGFPLPRPGARVWQPVVVSVVAVLAVALPALDLASATTAMLDGSRGSVGDLAATAEPTVPAAGAQAQSAPQHARVLELSVDDRGTVTYTALRSDGVQLVDSSAVVHLAEVGDATVAQLPLPTLVAELTTASSPTVADDLGRWGIGAVLVPATGDAQQRAALVARLDTVLGLQRATEGQADSVWRVTPTADDAPEDPAWASLVSSGRPTVVRSTGRSVDATIPDGAESRVVVLAESAGAGWHATLDGRSLARADADGRLAFAVGGDGGHLEVWHASGHQRPWLAVTMALLVFYVLLAVPVRRHRGGGHS